MRDKVSRFAERTAAHVSRRLFFSSFGRAALSVGVALAGATAAVAGKPPKYSCVQGGGCCSPGWYLRTDLTTGQKICCSQAGCPDGSGVVYAPSTCCNGGGICFAGAFCRYDPNTPC